jgi:stage V sporulation protein AF
MEKNKFDDYVGFFRKTLPIGQSFDVGERNVLIGGKEVYMYYVEGFFKSEVMERIFSVLFQISKSEMEKRKNASDFIKHHLPYMQTRIEKNTDKMIQALLSGLTVIIVDGYEDAIIMDLRTYPVRSVEEPEKEKSLRGPKDGLVETILFNTAMIRRRIRDPRLVFEMYTIGTISKTDVSIGYIKGLVDEKSLDRIRDKIGKIRQDTLTVGDQSLVEAMGQSYWLNPFPKVRYTQRPDVVAAPNSLIS